MDSVLLIRPFRRNRSRPARPRRACAPMMVDALEERMLLSVAPIKDINPVNLGPLEITGAGGKVYFVAQAADGKADLDILNGAGVMVLKEVPETSGQSASDMISNLTAVGANLFFSIRTGSDNELWVTDGTVAGTTQIVLQAGAQDIGLFPSLTAAGSRVYFTASVGSGDNVTLELYSSDGTAAGTVAVPTPAGSSSTTVSADNLVGHDGALYFSTGAQLFKTDGTVTTVIGTFGATSENIYGRGIDNMTDAGASFYFTSPDASGQGVGLYVSDGTKNGTKLLKDIKPAANASTYETVGSLVGAGSKLYFIANDAAHGPGLWVSNGTATGTTFVKSFGMIPSNAPYGAGLIGTPIGSMTAAGNRIFFTTETPSTTGSGITLWVSNGTAAGTTRISGISPAQDGGWSSTSLADGQFASLNGVLYFANNDPKHGVELWRSDGTAAGTRLVRDLKTGTAGSYPGNMAVVGNTLYFSASTTAGASEVWASDGTAAGTAKAATLNPQENGSGIYSGTPGSFGQLGNTIIFAANDGVHGTALWKTDGTAAGTTMVKVLNPNAYSIAPTNFTTVGKTLYFVTRQSDPKTGAATETLWKTNGTAAGTTRVLTDGKLIGSTIAFNGKLAFFETNPDLSGLTLWLSDGTAKGTKRVKGFANLTRSYGSDTPSMTAFQGKLYLVAPLSVDGGYAHESLWVSNGTAAGTKPVVAKPAFSDVQDVAAFQGKLYFTASSPKAELWSTNGTSAGTKLVAMIGTNPINDMSIIAAGTKLYVLTNYYGDYTNNYTLSTQLFRTNGTAKGTVLLHTFTNILAMSGAGLPNGKLALDVSNSDTVNDDLWISDGTKAGTVKVPGVQLSFEDTFVSLGGQLYFQGVDDAHGTEPWRTDGTIAGTTLVQDINPGPNSSSPYVLGAINGNLIVSADDGLHGTELFSIALPSKGTKNTKTH